MINIMKAQCYTSALILMIITHLHFIQLVEGMKPKIALQVSGKPEGTMKTIKAKDGDVIHCIDIYKQPSLNNPLLKNHTIQMNPSPDLLRRVKQTNEDPNIITSQNWSKDGGCPEGTIPIRRTTSPILRDNLPSRRINGSNGSGHKYANLNSRHTSADIYGTAACLNVWNPATEANDYSLSMISLVYVQGRDAIEAVQAGWMVNPRLFGDKRTRLFVMFTNDGYKTSCYNFHCKGFVQTSRTINIGATIWPLSVYKGTQYMIHVELILDRTTQNLWFVYGTTFVGYWPHALLPNLATASNFMSWGGEVYQYVPTTVATTTQMGSGHFSEDGYGKASYVANITYVDNDGNHVDPYARSVGYVQTESGCYSTTTMQHLDHLGMCFYFGGPGRSETCGL